MGDDTGHEQPGKPITRHVQRERVRQPRFGAYNELRPSGASTRLHYQFWDRCDYCGRRVGGGDLSDSCNCDERGRD